MIIFHVDKNYICYKSCLFLILIMFISDLQYVYSA